jgi:hypothetical protein
MPNAERDSRVSGYPRPRSTYLPYSWGWGFCYSHNPGYLSLTMLYAGIAILRNAL